MARPTLPAVLFSGTADDVARAQVDASPAHLWPEARHPANQWLANLKGQQRHRREVWVAGEQTRRFVRKAYRDAGYPIPGGLP